MKSGFFRQIVKGLRRLQNKKKIYFFLLIFAVGLFFFGIIRLFALRFEQGDIYPAYSSLRKDPLGTRILFEGLENMSGVSVRQNYTPLYKAVFENNGTLLYLGTNSLDPNFYDERTVNRLEQLVSSGGRLVISFLPISHLQRSVSDEIKSNDAGGTDDTQANQDAEASDESGKKKKPDVSDDAKIQERRDRFKRFLSRKKQDEPESLFRKWQFSFGRENESVKLENARPVKTARERQKLPTLRWHTSLYFKELGDAWQPVYTRNRHPVVIEKHMGKGSIVLTSGSYYFSNESVFNERQTGLLVWFLGKENTFIFDESHFGIQQNTGVVDLAIKYRLYWFALSGIILAGLFIWKSTSGFVPPRDEEDMIKSRGMPSSRNYKEGMVSLFRRNLQEKDILLICVEEWKKSFVTGNQISGQTGKMLDNIQSVLHHEKSKSPKKQSAVDAYNLISQIVSKRNVI